MEEVYRGTITELRPKLRESLSGLSFPEQDEAISLLTPLLDISSKPIKEGDVRIVDKSVTQPNTYYAIHNSDIEILKESVAIASGITLVGIPFGVIGALAVLLFQYRRKRFKLNEKQSIVLKTLKKAPNPPNPGWSVKVLATNLPINPWLEESEIESILTGLKSVIREDGKEDSLVAEKDGLWRAIDV
ncbi:MAG: hypothetical protein FD167_3538 [bacterium]|nr:MAG: hypothetical protein FD167_3538 [bacterium]